MENLPPVIIGEILSRIGSARDVIRASATCWDLREAFQEHLHTLSFCSKDWAGYRRLSVADLEIKITNAITQTMGLKRLLLLMDDIRHFLPSAVIGWISHTRGSLRELHYDVNTSPSLNILEFVDTQKLEVLELGHHILTGTQPHFLIFPCLRCLILRDVTILTPDLCIFINSCPTLESLELINVRTPNSGFVRRDTVELTAPSLKRVYFSDLSYLKIVLKADKMNSLHLNDLSVHIFHVSGNGALKHLMIEGLMPVQFHVGCWMENLDTIDISKLTISWPSLYKVISKSPKVRNLRLWQIMFPRDTVFDLGLIAASFPMLSHLSLYYYLEDEVYAYGLQGSRSFENVVFLKVGWCDHSEIRADCIEELILLCPSLKDLVISAEISDNDEFQKLSRFTTSIVPVIRRYSNVEIQFKYVDYF